MSEAVLCSMTASAPSAFISSTASTLPAISKVRLGWPVSLASVKSHFISRYDDGEVHHNIEATNTHPGGFVSNPDEMYIQRFDLPPKAITSGSDLRRLSTREMLGVFVAFRGNETGTQLVLLSLFERT